jgi:hypothetical protein
MMLGYEWERGSDRWRFENLGIDAKHLMLTAVRDFVNKRLVGPRLVQVVKSQWDIMR